MSGDGRLLVGPWAGLGFGGVVGLAVGYTVKKIGKLVLLGIGLIFLVLQALAWVELIAIDWTALQTTASDAWQTADGTLADRAWAVIGNNLPFGGGFVAGFALGFKMG